MRGSKIIFMVGFMAASISLLAQPGPGNPPPPNPVPINGVELLLGAGALLGMKKLWDQRKKSESNS